MWGFLLRSSYLGIKGWLHKEEKVFTIPKYSPSENKDRKLAYFFLSISRHTILCWAASFAHLSFIEGFISKFFNGS